MQSSRGTLLTLPAGLLLVIAASLLWPAPARAGSNIVISQIYTEGNEDGSTYRNNFIELFNRGNTTVSLDGLSVQLGPTVWQSTALSGSLAPGQYYLVQEGIGSRGILNLPTPDAMGRMLIGGGGTFALVYGTTPIPTGFGCPYINILDLIGYGGSSCVEGSGAVPSPQATTAAIRRGGGCFDTDNNASDFFIGPPTPRNTSSPFQPCSLAVSPSAVGLATPNELLTGAATRLTATATPGTLPTSTGLKVVVDLSSIGGAPAQAFFDNGTHGDVTAGDRVFSFLATVPIGTTLGIKTFPGVVSDAELRSAAFTISLAVTGVVPATTSSWGELKLLYR